MANMAKMATMKTGNSDSKSKKDKGSRSYTTSARTKALYDNCMLEAPDGDLLCTCDRRKAQWYIDQNLAEKIKDPFTVRLNFEPSGRAVGEVGEYYRIPKENKCVVCGNQEAFIRKNVVPREYRKHFPEIMKSHTSHDVLLLCPNCHQLSNISDIKVRHYLAEKCDAPLLFQEGGAKFTENPKVKEIRSAARALLRSSAKIPHDRKEILKKILFDQFPEIVELTEDFLEYASNLEILESVEDYCPHGLGVVNKYQAELGGLIELEKLWRSHFLNTMNPKFMPEYWSINHNVDRLEIRAEEGRVQKDDLIIAGMDPNLIKT